MGPEWRRPLCIRRECSCWTQALGGLIVHLNSLSGFRGHVGFAARSQGLGVGEEEEMNV